MGEKPTQVVLGSWRGENPEIHFVGSRPERTKCDRSIILNSTRRPRSIELSVCPACAIIYGLEQLGWSPSSSPFSASSARYR